MAKKPAAKPNPFAAFAKTDAKSDAAAAAKMGKGGVKAKAPNPFAKKKGK